MDEFLPDSGQNRGQLCSQRGIMLDVAPPEHRYGDLVAHLVRTSGLSDGEARRVVSDVLAYFSETADEYVRRRHSEMQASGLRNDEIFARVGDELAARRVAAPQLTDRQMRRLVYG